MDKKYMGKQIKKHREECKIGQEVFAEKLGLSPIYISYLECGSRTPSLSTLIKIAELLSVPVDIFLDRESSGNQSARLSYVDKKIQELGTETRVKLLDMIESLVEIEAGYHRTKKR